MERLNSFLKEDEFLLQIKGSSLYIKNYKRLITLEEKRITIQTKKERIRIQGKELKLKKILDRELLVKGQITSVEVLND